MKKINILTVNKRIPIHCITGLLTGQQFVDLLPAIELLTDYLIFIGLTSHVILTSAVIVNNIEVSSNDVVQILRPLNKYQNGYFSNIY